MPRELRELKKHQLATKENPVMPMPTWPIQTQEVYRDLDSAKAKWCERCERRPVYDNEEICERCYSRWLGF